MSLRLRLLTVLAVLVATYVVTAYLIVSAQRDILTGQADQRLRTLPPMAVSEVSRLPPPEPGTGSDVVESSQAGDPFSELYIAVVGSDGSIRPLVDGDLLQSTPDVSTAINATGGEGGLVTIEGTDGVVRFRAIVAPQPESEGWIVAAQSLEEADAAIDRLTRTFWIAGAVIASVLGVGVYWVHRHGLRPIARVTATAEAITAGNRSQRVAVPDRRTEAGKLGSAFNLMLDERDLSEARLRQFIADASHELRTPLTSVRGYLELYRQGAFREKTQLDDVVRRLSAESARMNGLVEDLLALANLDEGRPLRSEPVDLGELLRDAAQDAQAVQPTRHIATVTPLAGPVIAGDPESLNQLVGILVSNALAHTPVNVPITLRADHAPGQVTLTVADAGPGLGPDDAARVFDRFWRGQAGRVRVRRQMQGAGAGLGLAIARSITEAHGGTITLDTAPGAGCTFTVDLPAPPAPVRG
jgi:two-component system OmpR family sensor kinase